MTSLVSHVAMHRLWRESGQTNRNIFRPLGTRRAVLHPFTGRGDHGLTRHQIHRATAMRHAEHSPQHKGVLVELRSLTRFDPATRTAHVRDADPFVAGVYAAYVFVNQLGLVPRGFNPRR